MTPRYFAAVQKAETQKQQAEWERARYVGYLSMLPHVPSKKRLKITDLGRFPWENAEPVFDQQSDEEKALIKERHRILLERRRAQRQTVNGVS